MEKYLLDPTFLVEIEKCIKKRKREQKNLK